jgi:hypothetical protein
MTLKVFDPTAEVESEPTRLAPALSAFKGARIGLLDNSKIQVARFLDHVETLLREQHCVTDFVRCRKPDASKVVPPEVLTELSSCDAVISAVGD